MLHNQIQNLVNFIPQLVILPEFFIVIGMMILSHAMTTQISKFRIKLSALYVPMVIAGLFFVNVPPTLSEENAMKILFIHVLSLAAVITVPAVIALTIVHFAGGKKPT